MTVRNLFCVALLGALLPSGTAFAASDACPALFSGSFSAEPTFFNQVNYAIGSFIPGDEISIFVFSICPMTGCAGSLPQAFQLVDGSGNILAGPLVLPEGNGTLRFRVVTMLDKLGFENLGNFPMYVGAARCEGPAFVPTVGRVGLLAMFVLIALLAISALRAPSPHHTGA